MTRKLLALAFLLVVGCTATPPERVDGRPGPWAQPLDREGLPNLHRVSPVLYRGAQPEEPGYAELEKLGVRTVVSLRDWHTDRFDIRGTSLGYERIGMNAWRAKADEYARVLSIVGDEGRQPVFVHCKHGADRTGTLCALYRVVVQGWSRDDAIAEMTEGGYGFHSNFDNLIEFVRTVKREELAAD